jgi:hypothetical protein
LDIRWACAHSPDSEQTEYLVNVGDRFFNLLIIDIGRYKKHPGCRTLVCFVYDPEFRIGNPAELEDDLSGQQDTMDVRVVVSPGGG